MTVFDLCLRLRLTQGPYSLQILLEDLSHIGDLSSTCVLHGNTLKLKFLSF